MTLIRSVLCARPSWRAQVMRVKKGDKTIQMRHSNSKHFFFPFYRNCWHCTAAKESSLWRSAFSLSLYLVLLFFFNILYLDHATRTLWRSRSGARYSLLSLIYLSLLFISRFLVRSTLHMNTTSAAELSALIRQRTNGNPLYFTQCLKVADRANYLCL